MNLTVLETQLRSDGVVEYRCRAADGQQVIIRGG